MCQVKKMSKIINNQNKYKIISLSIKILNKKLINSHKPIINNHQTDHKPDLIK